MIVGAKDAGLTSIERRIRVSFLKQFPPGGTSFGWINISKFHLWPLWPDLLRHNPQVVEKLSHLTRNIPVTILAVYPDQTCDVELASNFIAQWERQGGWKVFCFGWEKGGEWGRIIILYIIYIFIYLFTHICAFMFIFAILSTKGLRSNPKKYMNDKPGLGRFCVKEGTGMKPGKPNVTLVRNQKPGKNTWVFPKITVPPKHPKMVIFSRNNHGCWVPSF